MSEPGASATVPTVDDALRLDARAARDALAAGALRGAALLERLAAIPALDRDAWIDELLGIDPPPPDIADLPRGVVPYLPCGVDEIVATVREAPLGPGDVLVDIGAGLGRVVMLGHLLSGARAVGIELQAPLVDRARARCAALGLDAVSFVHADAGEIDLDGSVFFLYAPCNGERLARVVRRLEAAARRRPIVIGAAGIELPELPWLRRRPASCASLALYDTVELDG